MLGHLGVNVPDLRAAKRYYDSIMPLLGFEVFLDADDEFAYRPLGGKPGTYLFFYPSAEMSGYSRHQTGLQHLAFMLRSRTAVNDVHQAIAELVPRFGGQVPARAAAFSSVSAAVLRDVLARPVGLHARGRLSPRPRLTIMSRSSPTGRRGRARSPSW